MKGNVNTGLYTHNKSEESVAFVNDQHKWLRSLEVKPKLPCSFAHLALHHPQLLAQVAVDFEQLLYFGLRCSEGALHLHELLHGDRSVGEVGRLGALRVMRERQGKAFFSVSGAVYTETDFFLKPHVFRKLSLENVSTMNLFWTHSP